MSGRDKAGPEPRPCRYGQSPGYEYRYSGVLPSGLPEGAVPLPSMSVEMPEGLRASVVRVASFLRRRYERGRRGTTVRAGEGTVIEPGVEPGMVKDP